MRLFTFSKLLLLFVLALSVEAKMISRTQVIMGTFITISLEQKNQKHLEKSFTIFKSLDSSLSSYKQTSIISELNLHKKASLDLYAYEALTLSREYYKETNGYFDISIGSITKDLFAFGTDERVPTFHELDNATVKLDGLDFNQTDVSIYEGMKIDLGGMGKGYGVDKVAQYLKSENVGKGVIAASGDIRCIDTCSIKVQDPFSNGIIASFTTRYNNTAISTSGNYNRYVKSLENNHLINPKDKRPQSTFISITLVSELPSSDLDAYATAVSVMPKTEAYRFLNSKNIAYIILQSDGVMVYSNSLFQLVENLSIKYTHKK